MVRRWRSPTRPPGLKIKSEVVDSGTAADGGANALERVADTKDVKFVVAPLFGTQVLAMLPVALEYKMPIMAPTGTGPVTEQGNPYMFPAVIRRMPSRRSDMSGTWSTS